MPRGHLRLLCPPAIAVHQLAKHLPRFQRDYPQVTLEIASPGAVDTVDEAYDLTLFTRRDAPDSDFIARRLARTEVVVCAAPEYLDRRGRPQHPRVLPEWRMFDFTLWAGMPTRRHLPARTRALLDFLLQTFGGENRDPWLAAAGCATRAVPTAAKT